MPNMFHKLGEFINKNGRRSQPDERSSLRPEKAKRHGPGSAIAQHMEGLQRLKERFNPERAAYQDAIEERIPVDHATNYEHTLATAFQNEISELQKSLGKYIKGVDADLNRDLPPEPSIDDAVILAQISAEQRLLLESWNRKLVEARQMVARTQVELQRFKKDNPRVAARLADDPNLVVAGVWMTAILVVETYLNSSFLITTRVFSFAEAAGLCFGTALANLFFGSVFIGYLGIRYLDHAQAKERWKGIACILAGTWILFGLHLVLAHFRMAVDILSANAASAGADITKSLAQLLPAAVSHTLRTKPASFLGNLHSIIVFLMGVVFATIAAAEGYWLLRDRYPGYQETDAEYHKALGRFSTMHNDFVDEVVGLTQDGNDKIDSVLHRGEERLKWIREHLNDAAAAVELYEQEVSQCWHELMHMVGAYRSEYCRLRQTSGPPHWRYQVPNLNREIPPFFDDMKRIEERENNQFQSLRSKCAQLQDHLNKKLAEFLEGREKFLNEVVQDSGPIILDNLYNQASGVRRPRPPSVN